MVPASIRANPLYARFEEFDGNNKGFLSKFDIAHMMQTLGYKSVNAYLENLMELYASFDDGDGQIRFDEFGESCLVLVVCGAATLHLRCSLLTCLSCRV